MRRVLVAAIVLLVLGLLRASPIAGQEYKSAVGWLGGAFYTTTLNSGVTGDATPMDPGVSWTMGAHYDRWFGSGRVGIRLQGAWASQNVPWTQGDRRIGVLSGDIDLTLRLASPDASRTVMPYLIAGGGFIRWALGSGAPATYPPGGAVYQGDEKFEPVAVGGLGFDFTTPWTWGDGDLIIRLEGRDHIQFSSPFDPIDPDAAAFGMVHNVSILLGIYTGLGIL